MSRWDGLTFEERFRARVEQGPGCWEWQGARDVGGYGTVVWPVATGQTKLRAHRVSWELTFGAIPPGLWVLHHCDNPPCVRPDHLFLGTVLANNRDTARKGRSGGTYQTRRALVRSVDVVRLREAGWQWVDIGEHLGMHPDSARRLYQFRVRGRRTVRKVYHRVALAPERSPK